MLQVKDFLADQTVLRSPAAPAGPRVSVILPTYRRHHSGQLQRALESVLRQTFADFELLVIDDGSTDGSADLIERLRAQDPRIVHVRHQRNCGLPGLRVNEGIELARGQYLAFQFDDDVWRPNALQALVRALEHADRPCVVVGKSFVSSRLYRHSLEESTLPAVELTLVSLYEQNRFANNSVLFARELVERYGMYDCHIALRRLTDWDLWLRYIKHVPFMVVEEVISEVYESEPGSLGTTVPWDLALFRYLHDIPRTSLLLPTTWHEYQVDALRVGGVEMARDFRRRVYEEHLLPYYLRCRASFPQIEGFRASLPRPPKTVLYTKSAYDITLDAAFSHFDSLASRRGSYKNTFQLVSQIEPGWQKEVDALLLVRVGEEQGKGLVSEALASGMPVGFYLDDDLLTFHEFGPQFDYLAPGAPYYQTLTTLLEGADTAWVTNGFIAASVLPYNPRILFHSSCVPREWLPGEVGPRNPAAPLRIGYVGSGYRQEEFALIWEALQRVSRRYGDKLAFEFWGLDVSSLPALASPTTQVKFTFSYFEYIARLRRARFDVLLTPLLDHPRPRLGKYLIKYFETAVAGALGIFSAVPQYAALPDRLTCLKAANDAEAWYAALEEVIAMPAQDFDRLRQRGVLHVSEEYTSAALIDQHEAAWRATELHARTRQKRYPDGRPRVVYVVHSAHMAGGEIQLWRRLGMMRAHGVEPVVVLPVILKTTPEAARIREAMDSQGIHLAFVHYTCFTSPCSPAEFTSSVELESIIPFLERVQPALVHTVTFIPSFGQACRKLGIPHVVSLYAIEDEFVWSHGSPEYRHCTLNQSDSIRYARRWAGLLGTEWFCAREVVPEEFFRLGFERSLRRREEAQGPAYDSPIRLVMTGTLQPRKRQAEAIEAVGQLRREGIDCRLDLYGYTHFFPDYYQRCLHLIETWGLQDRVVFRGFSSAIVTVLQDADIVLCPSTFESFPSAIKEAIAAGVLVVATPIGGIPELIIDQETGILCADTSVESFSDGIRRAAALTGEDYRRIVEAARRIARVELHPNRAANDLFSMYVRALELHAVANPSRDVAALRIASAAVDVRSEITENLGSPPLDYRSLARPRRYRLTPRLSRWKGVDVLLGTPLEREIKGRLAFQVCLENGVAIREGKMPFQVENAAGSWVKLEFSEVQHSAGQSFVLTLRLAEPRQAKVGLFESQSTRSLAERVARRLGVPRAGHHLFSRLVYSHPTV